MVVPEKLLMKKIKKREKIKKQLVAAKQEQKNTIDDTAGRENIVLSCECVIVEVRFILIIIILFTKHGQLQVLRAVLCD